MSYRDADPAEPIEARAIGATVNGVRIWSLYVPNGRALGDPHLDYKLDWFAHLAGATSDWMAAHPDDLDFGCSGTVAGWTKAGAEVTYVVITRGDQGGFDDTPREQMPAIREREQRDAAAALSAVVTT